MEITSAGVTGVLFVGVATVSYVVVVRRRSFETALGTAVLVMIWFAVWLWLRR